MTLDQDMLTMLQATSRTFYVPITRLPDRLQDAVGSAYLCMRAIDEIEDHPSLDKTSKSALLRDISLIFQAGASLRGAGLQELSALFDGFHDVLPRVSTRIGEWACKAPEGVAPDIWAATATMANRMAQWVEDSWAIHTESDLDRYTFAVAGSVGVLLCDVWAWFDGAQIDRTHAIQFGRGLQAVNILRNRPEDMARGVDLFPEGWTIEHMDAYARRNLGLAEAYARTLPACPFKYFIQIPLALAYATLDALLCGAPKLDRGSVARLIEGLESEQSTA